MIPNPYNFTVEEQKQLKVDLFEAYFECRRNKRSTHNALRFEIKQEDEVLRLYEAILSDTYTIGKSIAFIVFKPVQREIFAADFRDRVIHHYIIGKLEPVFEQLFIYDSYSCRKEKGTHFGVKRITRFLRACSNSYKQDCYILKLDIQGFFMNIDKKILLKVVLGIIEKRYNGFDKKLLADLATKVIMNNPVNGCIIRGTKKDWDGLPINKSLFHKNGERGLPIGNLTSQVFANLYLNPLDQFIKRDLKIKYYGRYVDDFVIIHPDKEYLISIITRVSEFLETELHLQLHPRKIYLQHYTKGVLFTGVFIKPYCQYIGKRTGNHLKKVFKTDYKSIFTEDESLSKQRLDHWLASANSLLGITKHYNTYRLREALLKPFKPQKNRRKVSSQITFFEYDDDYAVVRRLEEK